MFTAQEYTSQILTNFGSFIDDVTSWGGQDNDPKIYGVVFVALKFKSDVDDATQLDVQNNIVSDLSDNFAVASINTEFVDVNTSYLEILTTFNFDPDLTSATSSATEILIQDTINTYFSNNLQKFGRVFRRSNLLALLDDIDESILNTKMSIKIQKRFTPSLGVSRDYQINFPVELGSATGMGGHERQITSSKFTFNSKYCSIRSRLNSNVLEIINTSEGIEVDNIGSFDSKSGRVDLVGFKPTAVEGGEIKISARPANESTIRPLRASVIDIDPIASKANAVLDYQEIQASLSGSTSSTSSGSSSY